MTKGKLTDEIDYLRADEESDHYVVPADTPVTKSKITSERVLARHRNDVKWVSVNEVEYIDVSPAQMVGVSASLIPFLEHDDANRALMGSNMQRQAVPLLIAEKPIIGTGMEPCVAQHSGMLIRAEKAGKVTYLSLIHI